MSKLENFKGKQNTNGFDKNPDHINKSGRGISIMNEIKKRLADDSQTMVIEGDEVDEKNRPTGKVTKVRVKMMNMNALSLHYMNRLRKNDRLLTDLIDRIDGKPKQSVEVIQNEPLRIGYGFPPEALDDDADLSQVLDIYEDEDE